MNVHRVSAPYARRRERFVHIAYLDDSGSDPPSPITIVAAVLISPDIEFRKIGASVGFVVQDLIPEDKINEFQEFKACELYHGTGAFKDIDERLRFDAMHSLLVMVNNFKLPDNLFCSGQKETDEDGCRWS